MLHLNFYSFAEKKPNQGETIVYLKRENPFGLEAFTPHEATVNIEWAEFINGDYTGRAIKYDPANPVAPESILDEVSNENITYRLMIIVDGYEANHDWFWMPLNDYLDAFETEYFDAFDRIDLNE